MTDRPTSTVTRVFRPGSILRDRRAVAAVEFALLLPLMVTLFIGGNEISQALGIYRKVGHTSATLGDLVAQSGTLTIQQMNDIIAASVSVMTPYDSTGAKMIISAVKYTTSGGYKVCWSKAQNDTGWTIGSSPPVTIPTGLVTDGQQVVVTQVKYSYTSAFSTIMKDIWGTGAITLKDVSYFRPRTSATVIYDSKDCAA
ncbi:TadE/TadG family type IV pilus assembly protein [Pinisolibacter aquiterrae]|uniref:TadE/TadG family type IV pilus assembly protein n=1 Tax=Pinisolibacter aquiterrae TaxID=2815579 RepID=UPI001C3C3B31|nr:TadE/TadG family type IV pilus assembly protein [Pinisolibacter aquiterrae]MBV5266828.1 pilus assembly protein [Pinisolibacter aquiterrae]MCC8234858.1 pilus assembly protein [Pinisolibacter aquiterrae]